MKHFRVEQNSDAWARLRMGKATASAFERVITPAKRQNKDGEIIGWQPTKSETRRNYAIFLLTELILDMPLGGGTSAATEHGHASEGNARAAYEMLIGQEVEPVGFITNDEMTYGASPDGFVGERGSVEIKSPFKPEVHVAYLMNPESLVEEYFVQTQGQLFVSIREWTDLISYMPALPMVKVRVTPDEEFHKRLRVALHSFCAEFSDLVRRAVDLGYLKQTPPTTDWITAGGVDMVRKGSKKVEPAGDFDLSESDIRAIWENSQK